VNAFDEWVLDATSYRDGDPLTFYPIAENGDVVIGLAYVSDRPPGRCIGVMHEKGEVAAEAFANAHATLLDSLCAPGGSHA